MAAKTVFSQNKAYVLAEQPKPRFYCCASVVALERGGAEGGEVYKYELGSAGEGDDKNEKENRERVRMREEKKEE